MQDARAQLALLEAPAAAGDGTALDGFDPVAEVGVDGHLGLFWVVVAAAEDDVHDADAVIGDVLVAEAEGAGSGGGGVPREEAAAVPVRGRRGLHDIH